MKSEVAEDFFWEAVEYINSDTERARELIGKALAEDPKHANSLIHMGFLEME